MFNTGVLNQYKQRSFIAFGSGTTFATAAVVPVTIPREARFVSFIIVGPGAGGAAGVTGASGTSRRGGGAGGSGALTSAIFSIKNLPETVYLVLPGGATGSAASSGGNGQMATVQTSPVKTQTSNHTIIYAAGGTGGNISGSGGGGGSVTTLNTFCIQTPVSIVFSPGIGGTNSGAAVATANSVINYSLSPPAGGGGSTSSGTPFAGGSIAVGITAGANIFGLPASQVILPGGDNTGNPGLNGFHNLDNCTPYADASMPLYSLPGSGGGAVDSGTGGRGGNGAPGCGGGGGGAGTTGGAGGAGGPSFCIVEWW